MARTPMITRTIKTTIAQVFCVDVADSELFNKEVRLPRTYKDEKSLTKAVKAVIETDNIKAVAVVHTEVESLLYGMREQDFINNAVIMPNRITKEEQED